MFNDVSEFLKSQSISYYYLSNMTLDDNSLGLFDCCRVFKSQSYLVYPKVDIDNYRDLMDFEEKIVLMLREGNLFDALSYSNSRFEDGKFFYGLAFNSSIDYGRFSLRLLDGGIEQGNYKRSLDSEFIFYPCEFIAKNVENSNKDKYATSQNILK